MGNKKRFLGAETGLRALVTILGFLTITLTDASATTYYTTGNGNWNTSNGGS
jgi:hypothetical protein